MIKDKIVLHALEAVPHAGWNMNALREAAVAMGQEAQMADALFADGVRDATRHLTSIFDAQLMTRLKLIDATPLRVRDRITKAVLIRLDLMTRYRDGLTVAMTYWARPLRTIHAAKTLWQSADAIWNWAGDTSTDYNRYTKRALLSGVMASTMLFWLQDRTPQFTATHEFLDRRIENVLTIGRAIGGRKRKAA